MKSRWKLSILTWKISKSDRKQLREVLTRTKGLSHPVESGWLCKTCKSGVATFHIFGEQDEYLLKEKGMPGVFLLISRLAKND